MFDPTPSSLLLSPTDEETMVGGFFLLFPELDDYYISKKSN